MIGLFLILIFFISIFNSWAVGRSWVEAKVAGGLVRFMAWMGATMAKREAVVGPLQVAPLCGCWGVIDLGNGVKILGASHKTRRAAERWVERWGPLTEAEWSTVFLARCKSRRGEAVSDVERALLDRAYRTNKERYASLDADVFDATVPAGSAARYPR
jgi:hypothetical protein